jgi:hypothetical protein
MMDVGAFVVDGWDEAGDEKVDVVVDGELKEEIWRK